MSCWMKGPPRAEGRYWYWVGGSGVVRSQEVFLYDDELCIEMGEGPYSVKGPVRLWARCIKKPLLPTDEEMEALDVRRKAL